MAAYEAMDDGQLAGLLGPGDDAAFTEIYRRYWKRMLQVAWNHTKDKVLAEDVVHEVFLDLWERRAEVPVLNLPAFLATAVKFSIFKHYQREQRRQALTKRHIRFEELTLQEEEWDALFLKEYISGIVEQLPEKCKLVFKLSRGQGMKNSEIAGELGISEKGVEAHVTRALKTIRGNLERSGLALLLAGALHDLLK